MSGDIHIIVNSFNDAILVSDGTIGSDFCNTLHVFRRSAHKSSKKLLEQCQKLDKIWGHTFSAVITLTTPEAWYRKLRELIDRQQQGLLWMSQTKVIMFSKSFQILSILHAINDIPLNLIFVN